MRKFYLASSLHLHDTSIEPTWVPDEPKKEKGFVNIQMGNLDLLVFDISQAERVIEAGKRARQLFEEHEDA